MTNYDNVMEVLMLFPEKEESRTNFSDLYKKKYGYRQSLTTDASISTEKVTYPTRPTTPRSKYNDRRFMPTPKPFPKLFPRVRTTTLGKSTNILLSR